jgi:hypothetical protein
MAIAMELELRGFCRVVVLDLVDGGLVERGDAPRAAR